MGRASPCGRNIQRGQNWHSMPRQRCFLFAKLLSAERQGLEATPGGGCQARGRPSIEPTCACSEMARSRSARSQGYEQPCSSGSQQRIASLGQLPNFVERVFRRPSSPGLPRMRLARPPTPMPRKLMNPRPTAVADAYPWSARTVCKRVASHEGRLSVVTKRASCPLGLSPSRSHGMAARHARRLSRPRRGSACTSDLNRRDRARCG